MNLLDCQIIPFLDPNGLTLPFLRWMLWYIPLTHRDSLPKQGHCVFSYQHMYVTGSYITPRKNADLFLIQLIPSDIKWDPNATPPQFTNNEDTTIEPGTHVRVKIIGTRTEVGEMWAIGSIKEDYLGYVAQYEEKLSRIHTDTLLIQMLARLIDNWMSTALQLKPI